MVGEASDLRGRIDEIEQTYFTAGDEPDATSSTNERRPNAT